MWSRSDRAVLRAGLSFWGRSIIVKGDRDDDMPLGNARLLSAEEEMSLGARALGGDLAARNALVEANVRLAAKIAMAFRGRGLSTEDLVQESMLGLMKGADRFDPAHGCRFSTYASWWIRQALIKALADKGTTIRLPLNVAQDAQRLRRAERALRGELGREPAVEEVAAEAGVGVERATELMSKRLEPRSLEEHVGVDGDELGAFVAGSEVPADEAFGAAAANDELRDVVRDLPARERRAVVLRFGLEDGKERTLAEVGEVLGVTRERARQIVDVALARLSALLDRPIGGWSQRMSIPATSGKVRQLIRQRKLEKKKPDVARVTVTIASHGEAVVGKCRACGGQIMRREGCAHPVVHRCPSAVPA